MPALTASQPHAPVIPTKMILFSALSRLGFIASGLLLAYFSSGTEFQTRFTVARPNATQLVAGALAWTFALIAPPVFLIVGLAKVVETFELVSLRRRPPRPAAAVVRNLPEDHVVAS